MAKMVAKFVNQDGARLVVFAKTGKRGVNVAASLKHVGEGAQTGCRSTHATEEEGAAAFNQLKQAAIANGWSLVLPKVRSSFSTIPMANPTEASQEPKTKKTKAA
jgi:hypothetical protein